MRSDYEERREARIERLRERAEKAQGESEAQYSRSRQLLDPIPFGQPILVGHHSEKRHRNTIAKAHKAMDRSCEAYRKAQELERRAEAAERNTAISSDDPEALVKLREKLEDLRGRQEWMKQVNAAHKKFQKDPATLEAADLPDRTKEVIRNYKPRYSWEPHPFPPYSLSNNNANIKRVEGRIKQLEALETAETVEREIGGGIRIVENAEANRVQIFFPGKPSDEVRKAAKQWGFRWSPSEGAWQRHLSNGARWAAEQVVAKAQEVEA